MINQSIKIKETRGDAPLLYFYIIEDILGNQKDFYRLAYTPEEIRDWEFNKHKDEPIKLHIIYAFPTDAPPSPRVIQEDKPVKLTKKSFVRNLMYTKDFLVKDPSQKKILEGILSTI